MYLCFSEPEQKVNSKSKGAEFETPQAVFGFIMNLSSGANWWLHNCSFQNYLFADMPRKPVFFPNLPTPFNNSFLQAVLYVFIDP